MRQENCKDTACSKQRGKNDFGQGEENRQFDK